MRNATKIVFILAALLLSAGFVLAQHNHAATDIQSTPQSSGKDMMQACQKHRSETLAALDKLEKTIATGRQSNDPAKMKAALDQAQTDLVEAKHHMSMCPMMSGSMMHRGMSGGMMQHGGMDHMQRMNGMSGQQQNAPETPKEPQ
ncbi:MAG: hypothetical protein ACE14M_05515 [Terriglobales bacterium]